MYHKSVRFLQKTFKILPTKITAQVTSHNTRCRVLSNNLCNHFLCSVYLGLIRQFLHDHKEISLVVSSQWSWRPRNWSVASSAILRKCCSKAVVDSTSIVSVTLSVDIYTTAHSQLVQGGLVVKTACKCFVSCSKHSCIFYFFIFISHVNLILLSH